jgi:hypothetical protein
VGPMFGLKLDCATPVKAETDMTHAAKMPLLLTREDIDLAIQGTEECNWRPVAVCKGPIFAESVQDIGAFRRGRGTVAARCIPCYWRSSLQRLRAFEQFHVRSKQTERPTLSKEGPLIRGSCLTPAATQVRFSGRRLDRAG